MDRMQHSEVIPHAFTTAAKAVGYSLIARQAGVSYQTVSAMAENPVPGHKFRMRRKVAVVTIDQVQDRKARLLEEAAQIDGLLIRLQTWIDVDFDKKENQ